MTINNDYAQYAEWAKALESTHNKPVASKIDNGNVVAYVSKKTEGLPQWHRKHHVKAKL